MPQQPEVAEMCAVGGSILRMYGSVDPRYDNGDDKHVAEVVADLQEHSILIAHAPEQPTTVYGFGAYALEGDSMHIGYVAVHPRIRSRGVGSTILTALTEIAGSQDIAEMWLTAMNSRNEKLYTRHGFQPQGADIKGRTIMRRKLTDI